MTPCLTNAALRANTTKADRLPDQPARRTARQCAVALLLVAGLVSAHAQHNRDGGRDDHRRDVGRGHPGQWYDGAHGNNRYYPQPGWTVPGVPSRSRVVVWGGVNYRYLDSVWYAPGPRGYVVARPPFGVVIGERPAFFTLVTIGAIAYLYANGVYYREHSGGGYEVVPPPVEGLPSAPAPAPVSAPPARNYVYPRQGQNAEQQASDEYECHKWAVSQSGFDPTSAATGQKSAPAAAQRDGYQRATSACLEGRGYTVR